MTCPALLPAERWMDATPLVSGRSRKVVALGLSYIFVGCEERFSKLITGSHVRLNMKPAPLLKYSACC